MLLARVTGTVVASRKEPLVEGLTMLLVEPTDPAGKAAGAAFVAADTVGAGVGDLVMIATGSSARRTERTHKCPVDAVVMAIVDLVEHQTDMAYRKDLENA